MTQPPLERTESLRDTIASVLERARARSTTLTGSVDDVDLTAQHSRLMSPLVWDLAHIGNQEEQWLVRTVGERTPIRADIDEMYDAFQHPRADRPQLPLLGPDATRDYIRIVREKVLGVLDSTSFDGTPLTSGGFVFGMVAQHEQQHAETMLATHQLRRGAPVLTAPNPPTADVDVTGEAIIPAGSFEMGTSSDLWALDNERPAHTVWVDEFAIDRAPVTNGQYMEFLADGGYDRQDLWSAPGWEHRCASELNAPLFWRHDGTWRRRRFGYEEPIPENEPVMHVCFYEAEAFANWAGKRLPTEAEWEKAARWDPATGTSRRYPWGDAEPTLDHANLGQRHLQPAPVGAYPAGASPLGVHQLIGDVWEWTSSFFHAYPGFRFFPYAEYSDVFFGEDYRVLRGGSFGTDSVAMRGTFRNWDYPIRRQIFAGFRLARDITT
ncbi:ergothioneine biosynthesis protein EgtB [Hoyosella rhizosphaerae]|uniref:Hercynine oxygenase n=1 Tax=Hoyosella rhizosphaerae TaxID=1755582 RepID=A0A916XA88_9ACTN|nr:ergothioneine biosynthesis protein EgtB [Hoyosella rhizosphaerae]MBN4926777.1 ergothioneine biosynthesis protein EgtB [Hoyosella rhizosphaerae]GGC56521.1 hercynine oxygenase [Hoyosella rhizosphaerae]